MTDGTSDSCTIVPTTTDGSDPCDGIDNDCDGLVDEDFTPTQSPSSCGVGATSGTNQGINGVVQIVFTPLTTSTSEDLCDGIDNDCDGQVDKVVFAKNWCGATSCVAGQIVDSCVAGSASSTSDPCDGLDNDCDGQVDEDFTPSPSTCGVGACGSTGTNQCVNGIITNVCTPLTSTTTSDPCDGIDNDCDGLVDEDYVDTVSTCGNGVCGSTGLKKCIGGQIVDTCVAGTPTTTSDPCDGLDNDCDGQVDEDFTQSPSVCGVGACATSGTYKCISGVVDNVCTPLTPTTTSDPCDGIDNDCDGLVDEDFVESSTSCGVGICGSTGFRRCVAGKIVDTCVAGTPQTSDHCDGLDNDCDGQVDEDFVETQSTCGVGACGATGTYKCIHGLVQNICTPKARVTIVDQCDGIDNDCDGQIDEDFKVNTVGCGKGLCRATGITKCQGGLIINTCVELPPQSTTDPCDGFDNDCDGLVDEDFVSATTTCGIGACTSTGVTSCVNGIIVDSCVAGTADLLDDNCDGIDDNCNGQADEGYVPTQTSCGTGACATTGTRQCVNGQVVDNCVAKDPSPDNNCDGQDNDCDGQVDEEFQPYSIQCGTICSVYGEVVCTANGIHSTCSPSSIDYCDGQDNDCDGLIDEDARNRTTTCGVGVCKADGVEACISGSYQSQCTPLQPQSSVDDTCDGLDNNCDGQVDEGFVETTVTCGLGVCQRTNTTSCDAGTLIDVCIPGKPQSNSDRVCDGLDNDCDGQVDEDYVNFPITCGVGYCKSNGYQVCEDGVTKEECTANSPLSSTDDTCDGIDDNCDGAVDEGFEGTTVTCGLGECINTVTSQCVGGIIEDNNCVPLSAPATIDNTCDGLDNDCDGSVDEDYVKETISCGVGACKRDGERECIAGVVTETCTPGNPASNDAICNGIDDNCNGEVDEGFQPFQGSEYCDQYKCNKKTFVCEGGNIVDNCATFLDSDNDGVPDNCDRCAGYNDFVDSDGDSVPDGCDVCPKFNDLQDENQDGIPDGCNDICGLGIHCNATDGCQPTLPLDCSKTIISNCAVFECVANGCQSKEFSTDYVLNHYFTLTSEGAYDLYRVRGSTDYLIGSDRHESKDIYWVGLSFNNANGELYGIDSSKVLRKISTYNGKSSKAVDLSSAVQGEVVDIAFHPDGTLSVLSLAEADLYAAYEFKLPSTEPIYSATIQRNNYDLRAITWDTFGYYLYIVDGNGAYYQVERTLTSDTVITSMCFTFTGLKSRNISPKGLAMSVNGTLLTGWGYDANKIAYSQVDSRDCIGDQDFLQKLSIVSASVAYTAVESCVRPAGISSTGGGGGGGSSNAFPGATTNNVLENYPTTAVATAVAGGFLGLCAIFAVLIAVNSTKSKEEVPLDTILETSEANAVAHDNAIYLNGNSTLQNTMYS